MKGFDIVGYTYQAETYCPRCIIKAMGIDPREYWVPEPGITPSTEDELAIIAPALGIDRLDEFTFDSGDFPKVIFASSIDEYETCAACGADLVEDFPG